MLVVRFPTSRPYRMPALGSSRGTRFLRAFVSTRLDWALAEHAALRREPPRSPLHGVPYSLKDTWDVAGEITTGGSYRYRDRASLHDSPVYRAFRDAGAVLLGKTYFSDLMLVPESASYVGGVGNNPHDLSRTCGGSSGGAAAAVADGLVAFDWGSDVGGSIRTPAAYCGALGMRLSSETWPMLGDFPKLPPSLGWMNGQGPITARTGRMRDVLRVAAPVLRTGPERSFRLRGAMLYEPDRRIEGQWPTLGRDVEPVVRAAIEDEVRRDHGLLGPLRAYRIALAMWASHFEDLLASDVLTLSVRASARWPRRSCSAVALVICDCTRTPPGCCPSSSWGASRCFATAPPPDKRHGTFATPCERFGTAGMC